MIRFLLTWSLWLTPVLSMAQTPPVETPLGFPVTLTDIYIPGAEAEPIPRKDNASSLVIRVLAIKPAADGHRYDLEVYGLDAGIHALADYLQYMGGEPVQGLETTLRVTTKHALDELPQPQELTLVSPKKLGGYRMVSIALGVLWFAGLLAILFYKKRGPAAEAASERPLTLHEKLHALVTRAAEGALSEDEKAQLERLIVGHWKREIPDLDADSPAKALRELRQHPEASPLIMKLEEWLHAPNASTNQEEIQRLLQPFQGSHV